ncbi:hypothetical protein [uncultured Paraglaciecola sp.]|uniref:hypothetical protein n=1 Tax=uncultured Paraglaciecola sp. TaxID=1765024 RepID=UPI0026173476|nr:hypothetical protein [uncultured Paraglaciecola sp.]
MDKDKAFLRQRSTGRIYGFNEKVLEHGTDMEVVTAEIAFPEKFKPASRKARKVKVDTSTDEKAVEEAVKEPVKQPEGLEEEASRNLPLTGGLTVEPATKEFGKGSRKG